MAVPTEQELEVMLGQLKLRFEHVLKQGNIKVPEIESCRHELEFMKSSGHPSNPEQLERHYQRLQKLSQLAGEFYKACQNLHASVLLFPTPKGNLTAHIRYPVYDQSMMFDPKNPLGYNSVKVKHAAKEVADSMGLKFESNFWGTKMKVRNQDGSILSDEQVESYFKLMETSLNKQGLGAYVGRLPPEDASSLGLSGTSTAGLRTATPTAPPASALASAGISAVPPPLTSLGAPGAAASLAAPSSPTASEPGSADSVGSP